MKYLFPDKHPSLLIVSWHKVQSCHVLRMLNSHWSHWRTRMLITFQVCKCSASFRIWSKVNFHSELRANKVALLVFCFFFPFFPPFFMSESNKWTECYFPLNIICAFEGFCWQADCSGIFNSLICWIYAARSFTTLQVHTQGKHIHIFFKIYHATKIQIKRNKGKVGKYTESKGWAICMAPFRLFCCFANGVKYEQSHHCLWGRRDTKPGCSLPKPPSIWSTVSAKWSRVILILHLY